MEHPVNNDLCSLCAIICTVCGAPIERDASYYTVGSGEARKCFFCTPCYNEILETSPKRKIDEGNQWVKCDKCNQWNHQVCVLFNARMNVGGEAVYACPRCCIDRGNEPKPLLSATVLGAKDLPKTLLSDHLEQRLALRLRKHINTVPEADSLVVRVVYSVSKVLKVKQRFLDMLKEEHYPTEFPYESKVILLFQNIEGAEVCLFAMYVQEFGAECQDPNKRRVYLSYLDSVNYFRPHVKTVSGETLRTYVYHEILIAYLEYCKSRGFLSCYIWASPAPAGEDYIFHCHPKLQKRPYPNKLRDWYLSMLKKATKDGIVVDVTNLYDYFFLSKNECKAKMTAARLPYFDGDYWPDKVEDIIMQLQEEEEERGELQKKLMYKVGKSILPTKNCFIMVHLRYACTHCRDFILSGYRWTCEQCKNFQICDRCHDEEQELEEKDRHPISRRKAHVLIPMAVEKVSQETKDKDEVVESKFFCSPQAFLNLCRGNDYQFDTLQRAKYSSMMVLYHLHNPKAPAFFVRCDICLEYIATGESNLCEDCNLSKRPYRLHPHPSAYERNTQGDEAKRKWFLEIQEKLDWLVHASSQCGECDNVNCKAIKRLLRHGKRCQILASGGCARCKEIKGILNLHARDCKKSKCEVPECKDPKVLQQLQSRRLDATVDLDGTLELCCFCYFYTDGARARSRRLLKAVS